MIGYYQRDNYPTENKERGCKQIDLNEKINILFCATKINKEKIIWQTATIIRTDIQAPDLSHSQKECDSG